MIKAAVIGGSGYTGGELLRLLLDHPQIEVVQATSRRNLGQYVYQVHPNLRKRTSLKFSAPQPETLPEVDLLFLALPHGQSQAAVEAWAGRTTYLVDLSADFRLRDPAAYQAWYGSDHLAPDWLPRFVYGLPELTRDSLKQARYVSGVGCNAAAAILAILPLFQADLLEPGSSLLIEVKVGSSEGGASGNPGSHHPERSGVIRTYSPFGHRHTAEIIQAFGIEAVTMTLTSVDLVRGALATVHGTLRSGIELKDLWQAYRVLVTDHPFLRLVRERRGLYRVPEPKILAGSNYADLGFDLHSDGRQVLSICALDNLMKGAAGSAVQAANLMLGYPETAGLDFSGLHPI